MALIKYYFELGPYPVTNSRVAGGAVTNAQHLTLEGAIQEYIDSVHILLNNTQGQDLSDDPGTAAQLDPSYVALQVDALAKFWPRFYLDSVPKGQTADQIAAKFKSDLVALFSAYGR